MSGGSGLSLRSDDLDSVVELYTEDDFRQLVVAAEAMPTFLGGLCELEDHAQSDQSFRWYEPLQDSNIFRGTYDLRCCPFSRPLENKIINRDDGA